MISGWTSVPAARTFTAASKMARTCISYTSGRSPEAAAAVAEHRVGLVERLGALREPRHRDLHRAREPAELLGRVSAGTRAGEGRGGGS